MSGLASGMPVDAFCPVEAAPGISDLSAMRPRGGSEGIRLLAIMATETSA